MEKAEMDKMRHFYHVEYKDSIPTPLICTEFFISRFFRLCPGVKAH